MSEASRWLTTFFLNAIWQICDHAVCTPMRPTTAAYAVALHAQGLGFGIDLLSAGSVNDRSNPESEWRCDGGREVDRTSGESNHHLFLIARSGHIASLHEPFCLCPADSIGSLDVDTCYVASLQSHAAGIDRL